jgi:hypothetical protein
MMSEDMFETVLDYMKISEESCRHKFICKMEKAASNLAKNNPLARMGVNTFK